MPASRAACRGSPFLTSPRLIRRSASRDMLIDPRAIASRVVTGLWPTSTIRTRPRESTCDSRSVLRARVFFSSLAAGAFVFLIATRVALRQKEREAFQRNRQIDAFQLHVVGHLQRAGREIQDCFDSRGDNEVEDLLRRGLRDGDDRDADRFAPRDLLEIVDVVNRDAAARLLPHLLAQVVEERGNLEAFHPEAGVVGERQTEIAGAHDRDAQLAIEAENLSEMALQVADIVADPAHAELAEVGEVLADLRGVQMKLLGERLRRDRADAGVFERVQAPEIYGQSIGREL